MAPYDLFDADAERKRGILVLVGAIVVFSSAGLAWAHFFAQGLLLKASVYLLVAFTIGGAILLEPLVGLCLMVFLVPVEELYAFAGGWIAVTKAIGVVTFAAFLVKSQLRHAILHFDKASRWMLLFGLWTALSFLWTKQKSGTPLFLVLTVGQLVLFWVLVQASVQTRHELSAISYCFVAGTLLAVFVSVILPRWSLAPRLIFTTGNPNHLARDVVTSLLLLLYFMPGMGRRAMLVAVGAGAVLALSLVLTQSRSSWLGAIASVTILLIGHRKVFPFVALGGMALAAAALFSLEVLSAHLGVTETVLETRWGSIFDEHSIRASRVDIWRAGIILGSRSPLLGVGAGAFAERLPEAVETMPEYLAATARLDAHNSFVCAFGELGLVGLALLIGILWQCGRSIARHASFLEKMLAWALFFSVVSRMLFGTIYYQKTTWLALALTQVVLRKEFAGEGSEDDISYEERSD